MACAPLSYDLILIGIGKKALWVGIFFAGRECDFVMGGIVLMEKRSIRSNF